LFLVLWLGGVNAVQISEGVVCFRLLFKGVQSQFDLFSFALCFLKLTLFLVCPLTFSLVLFVTVKAVCQSFHTITECTDLDCPCGVL
jgi:hypothetical protein